MEENMKPLTTTFTRAARDIDPGFSVFWLMVFAIAILDDAERREKEQRKKREQAKQPLKPKPKRPPGPRF